MTDGPRWGNVLAAALGLLVGLGLLELGIRWRFSPPPPHPPVSLNSIDFRDAEHPVDKPEGMVRIAFIGDSYTFGQGVEAEERFSDRVAARLDELWSDVRVVSLNFGRPGASTADVLRIYESGVQAFDPDIVVYSFVLNDFSNRELDLGFREERDRIRDEHRARFPGLRLASRWSRTAAVFDRLLFDTTSGIERAQLDFLASLYEPGPGRRRADARLQRLTRLMSRNHPLGLVVFMPYFLPEEESLPFYREARERVAESADRPRLEFVEVLPELIDRPYHEWWVSASDHHPNAAAHARIADLISERIRAQTGDSWRHFDRRRGRRLDDDSGGKQSEGVAVIVPSSESPDSR